MPDNSNPAIRRYIEAHESTLGNVILPLDRRFVVPLNQRPWAWIRPTMVQALLNDFEATMTKHYNCLTVPKWAYPKQDPGPPHFFGTFVFYTCDSDTYEIFDGQQRITAISMLCAVLQELAYELQANHSLTQSQSEMGLYGVFRQWLLVSPPSIHPRLSPDSLFHGLFEALIFGCVRDEDRRTKLDSLPSEIKEHTTTRRLTQSFYQIRNWVHERVRNCSSDERSNYLAAAHDVLKNHFACVETTIKDEPYAFEVFGCLNARGVSLCETDKIKNELFKASEKSHHPKISIDWGQMSKNVRSLEIGEFLRRRYIALHGACKTHETYDNIKIHEIGSSEDPKTIVAGWLEDSRLVSRLEARDSTLMDEQSVMHIRVSLDVLGVSLAVIPLLAAGKQFLPQDTVKFRECASMIEKFVFRQLTICGVKTTDLEVQLGDASRALRSESGVTEFRRSLQKRTSDAMFEERFAGFSTRRNKVIYYILREIETHMLGNGSGVVPGNHDQFRNNLEHILPKRFSTRVSRLNEWEWARNDADLHKNLVNRLGNILILESNINQDVSTYDFTVKQKGFVKQGRHVRERKFKGYCHSALKWPRKLADETEWRDWTEETIEERQKQMARVALEVWSL